MKVGLFGDKHAEKEAEAAAVAAGETLPVVAPPQPACAAPLMLMGTTVDRRCCCGCSSRTGCIIIGTLSMLHGFAMLYLSLVYMNAFHVGERGTLALVLMILLGLIHVLTGMGVIYGADRGRPKLVTMWLYVHYAELGLYLGYFCINLGHMIYLGLPAEPILGAIASCVIGTSILSYCISIVRGFHRQLLAASAALLVPLKDTV